MADADGGSKSEEVRTGSKHPLQHTWVLYELREAQGRESYTAQHFKLFEFATVEDFWANWVHVPKPSEVFDGGSDSDPKPSIKRVDTVTGDERVSPVEAYVLFRKDLEPDTKFRLPNGEYATNFELRWRANRSRRFQEFDKAWEILVLGIIGQCFESNDSITGARFVDKCSRGTPIARMEVWMSGPEHSEAVMDTSKRAIELDTRGKSGTGGGRYGAGGLSPSWSTKPHNSSSGRY